MPTFNNKIDGMANSIKHVALKEEYLPEEKGATMLHEINRDAEYLQQHESICYAE